MVAIWLGALLRARRGEGHMARSLVASPPRRGSHGSEPYCEPSEVVSTWLGALLRALRGEGHMAKSLVASSREANSHGLEPCCEPSSHVGGARPLHPIAPQPKTGGTTVFEGVPYVRLFRKASTVGAVAAGPSSAMGLDASRIFLQPTRRCIGEPPRGQRAR